MKELSIENIKTDLSLNSNGVYKIFLYKDGKPMSISRFLETDKTGLVYIGAAEKTKLSYRLTCFLNSKNSEKKQNNHSGVDKIKQNEKLKKIISKLVFMYQITVTEDAKEQERRTLKEYVKHFGEVPPLNG